MLASHGAIAYDKDMVRTEAFGADIIRTADGIVQKSRTYHLKYWDGLLRVSCDEVLVILVDHGRFRALSSSPRPRSSKLSTATEAREGGPAHDRLLSCASSRNPRHRFAQYLFPSLSTSANSSNGLRPSLVSFHRLGVRKP